MSAPDTRGAAQGLSNEVTANDDRDLALSPETNQSIVVLPVPGDLESIPSHPPSGAPLSEDAARTLTDIIRRDTQSLWQMLLRAYEGNAHGALGYTSWPAYCAAEIQIGRARSYQILDAARVANEVQSTIVDSGVVPPILTEAVARELAPMLDDPAELREAYTEAVKTAPRDVAGASKVTAAHVRETVGRRQGASVDKPRTQATLADAVGRVVTVIRLGGPAEIQTAIEAALRVLARRRMGTSPEALAECVAALLGAMLDMLRVKK